MLFAAAACRAARSARASAAATLRSFAAPIVLEPQARSGSNAALAAVAAAASAFFTSVVFVLVDFVDVGFVAVDFVVAVFVDVFVGALDAAVGVDVEVLAAPDGACALEDDDPDWSFFDAFAELAGVGAFDVGSDAFGSGADGVALPAVDGLLLSPPFDGFVLSAPLLPCAPALP